MVCLHANKAIEQRRVSMKIISWNVNGIRAVYRKNFLKWLASTQAGIVCLQETKAQENQLPSELINPGNYYSYFNSAFKKGYSGVAVYTKKRPLAIKRVLNLQRFDAEGRILELHYSRFTLINLYLPQGGRRKENLAYKLDVYRRLISYLKKFKRENVILTGDFNVAHEEIDLARPKQNRKNIMFTPEEREQISNLIYLGFTDTFRQFNKEGGFYTWWPYFANARQRNLGWRIDYVFVSKKIISKVKKAFILNQVTGSDHCPVGIEIETEF